ncbi:ABC transporter permease [Flammeovirgaceae bacterium SG7u.111]|nr:ABC transporter permease [Flammeovirgaceae bacterium SG7u.132]WPO36302.1 ABC transporter permease [Flammeovirgaceae bacterium SG7u.111]
MKQFLVFTQKEFYHIFRDRWTMMILLALPVAMIILFGFGITTEIKNTKFAVYDPSRDDATQGITNKMEQNEYFTLTGYLDKPEQIETVFKEGKIGLLVVFSEQFNENMLRTGDAQIQLIADGTDPNTASTLTSYASNIIREYQQEALNMQNIPFSIHPEVKLLYNPTMKGAYNIVPGVIGMILMLICAMMTSVSIAREKEMGTMEIILVSPMPPVLIILSKVVPYFVISIVNLTNVLLLSVFVLEVPIVGSLWLIVFVSLLFIFVALALGLLISTMVDTQLVALLFSVMGLLMPVILLSGLMFPIENMPIALQYVAQIIPAKWYITAMRNVMIKGLGFESIIKEMIILSIMAVVLITVSLKKFKIRLE